MTGLQQLGATALQGWTDMTQKRAAPLLAALFVLVAVAMQYTAGNLKMNTDTEDMLSATLPWRQLDQQYEALFPQYDNNILVVLSADTPDQALDAAALLHRRLQTEQALFDSVYYPKALPNFRESGLLYLAPQALQALADELAAAQPLLARLSRDLSLRGLFETLAEALTAPAEAGVAMELTPALEQVNAAIAALAEPGVRRVSWQQLISGAAAEAGAVYREFILLQPRLDYGDLFPASAAIDRLWALYEELGLANSPGARLHLTGGVMLAHEELQSVTRGAATTAGLALCMVTIMLLLGLGSLRLTLVTVVSLVAGLALTAAFATLTVGRLNLISVAFAALYIGLGVDFAIHYCLRYRECLLSGVDNRTALNNTSKQVGGSLFLCAVSTAVGFFAFTFTDYTGVAELGWISGFGMFISFAVTLTALPALLALFPLRERRRQATFMPAWLAALPGRYSGRILLLTVLSAGAAALALDRMHFDHNPLNLQAQEGAALKTFRQLLADEALSPWTGIMVAADATEAAAYQRLFEHSERVADTRQAQDFIPTEQEAKLALIDELALLLGGLSAPENGDLPALEPGQRLRAAQDFADSLRQLRHPAPVAHALQQNLARLLEESPAVRAEKLLRLEQSILASLPGRLTELADSLNARPVSLANLPPELRARWVSADGQRRIEIYPREDLQNNTALRDFVRAVQAVSPRVIGAPVINLEASDAVAAAFRQAFLYAFVVITLMLLLLLPHKRDVALVLTPLLTAALLTAGLSVPLGIPLNFANIIALPLLLGIGVDSGIHIMRRYRAEQSRVEQLMAGSSARAVLVSALTTMVGIGNLCASPHAGTASLGMLLTLGIGVTLICMLVALPAVLVRLPRR